MQSPIMACMGRCSSHVCRQQAIRMFETSIVQIQSMSNVQDEQITASLQPFHAHRLTARKDSLHACRLEDPGKLGC